VRGVSEGAEKENERFAWTIELQVRCMSGDGERWERMGWDGVGVDIWSIFGLLYQGLHCCFLNSQRIGSAACSRVLVPSRLCGSHYPQDCQRRPHLPIQPPSTTSVCPLTYPLALLARYTAVPLKSSGLPHRAAGMRALMLARRSGSLSSAVFISVSM